MGKGLALPGVVMRLVVHPNASHGCCKHQGFLCVIFSGYTGTYLRGDTQDEGDPGGGEGNGAQTSPPGDPFSSR